MTWKKWLSLAALVALAGWLWWWAQPEQQVARAQRKLMSALESRDFESFAALVAGDYSDRWGHSKAIVLKNVKLVFAEFLTLDIERERVALEIGGAGWIIREKIQVRGLGNPIAMYARDQVNQLRQPFAMNWRRRAWNEWVLVSVEQPELDLPRVME